MLLMGYGILAVLVIAISIRLSYYVDVLDQKSNLSAAFLGGVMLAAVTSLPELFTSIASTVFLQKSELVLGNILGSNLFNLAALSFVLLFCLRRLGRYDLMKSHRTVVFCTVLIFFLLVIAANGLLELHFWGISWISYGIVLLYLYGLRKMSGDTAEDERQEDNCPLTVGQVMTRFVLFSIALVIFSILITFVTDAISLRYGLGASLAGALFLGVATSLPELSSTIALAKLGNFNAMFGNILGSNLFNFFILFLADLLYTSGSIYYFSQDSLFLLYFGLAASLVMWILLLRTRKAEPKRWLFRGVCFSCVFLCYVGFLLLSMI